VHPNGLTVINLHVSNNLLAHWWPPLLSVRAVYTELELCQRLKQSFISVGCGAGYRTSKTSIPYQTPSPFMISFQSEMH